MLNQEEIEQQLQLLETHRRTLAVYLRQAASHGENFIPPQVAHGIDDAREEIRRIKATLRDNGESLQDHPDDLPLSYSRPLRVDQRNRNRLLKKVKKDWIEDLLERSLDRSSLIPLGIEYKPEAVARPWDKFVQRPHAPQTILPPDKKIIDIFDELGEELLILGAAGSGKTTILLELVRDLLARAEHDQTQPVPIVFNLSSWAEQSRPIVEWLVDQLNTNYSIKRKTGREWIETHSVLPLLDGLDEVPQKHRAACAKAINTFQRDFGPVSLVICCRLDDYEALSIRLQVQGAIFLQPLNKHQIDAYLKRFGRSLVGIRTALRDDANLWELLNTPLLLKVFIHIYKDKSPAALRMKGTLEERRKFLFDTYIEEMFDRKVESTRYSREQTIKWLVTLARNMSHYDKTTFFIEELQPFWLQRKAQKWMYNLAALLVPMILAGLVVGVVVSLLAGPQSGVFYGFLFASFGLFPIRIKDRMIKIECVETFHWSWSAVLRGIVMALALIIGSMIVIALFGIARGYTEQLFILLFIGPETLLIGVIIQGITSTQVTTRAMPNQGIRRSLRNAVVIGFVSGVVGTIVGALTGALAIWLFGGQVKGIPTGPNGVAAGAIVAGLLGGMAGALSGGLAFGGLACIHHGILRLILFGSGTVPWNCGRFLDYATARIFLYKVGGGYIFAHGLLMEHLASLDSSKSDRTFHEERDG